MNRRMGLLILFLVTLSTVAYAQTIETTTPLVEKGETILLHGTFTPSSNGALEAMLNEKLIVSLPFTSDASGLFSLEYDSTFLDPSGEWEWIISDTDARVETQVIPSIDSAVLVIQLISPSGTRVVRGEIIPVSVRILHDGALLEGATVRTWDREGNPVSLTPLSAGNHAGEISLSYSSESGPWSLQVVAEGISSDGTLMGGETTSILTVQPAIIPIHVHEPAAAQVEIEQMIPLRISVDSPEQGDWSGLQATAEIEGQIIPLQPDPDTFHGSVMAARAWAGEIPILFRVEDQYGNTGQTTVVISVTGLEALWWKDHALTLGAVILVVLVAAGISIRKTAAGVRQMGLSQRKKKVEVELMELQRQYFTEQRIDRKTYSEKRVELESQIAEIEKKQAQGEK